MSKPVLAMGLLAVMAGAWYWALLTPLAPAAPARDASARTAAAKAVPAVGLDRLATRVVPALPGVAGRDPFRRATVSLSAPSSSAQASRADSGVRGPAPTATPAAPVWPRVELIGVAEGREGAALVRTAILSGPQGVHHVRAGDVVEGVYRVERIAADGVDVRLVPEDRVVRLSLRP